MLQVVASEKASPWEAGLLEEVTGPCHPDPQGIVQALTTAPFLHVCATWTGDWRGGGVGVRAEVGRTQQEADLRGQSTPLEPRGAQAPGPKTGCSHLESEIVISVGKVLQFGNEMPLRGLLSWFYRRGAVHTAE